MPTETDYQTTIIEAARIGGWRHVHFRPARTTHGWRTPFTGDPGFPDLILVRERVIFAELKRRPNQLTPEQRAWLGALSLAGADARLILLPDDLDTFCTELVSKSAPLSTDPGRTR
jgi:hypothetical protein